MYGGIFLLLFRPTGEAKITNMSRSKFHSAVDSMAHACLPENKVNIIKCHHMNIEKLMTYFAFNFTILVSEHDVSWKKIALPGIGCFLAVKISSKYTIDVGELPFNSIAL